MPRRRAKDRIDNATSILRLGLVLGAGYLLYQRFQAENAAQARVVPPPAPVSAMQPMPPSAPAPLPSQQPTNIAYQGATDDQIDTTRQLAAPQAISLDPRTWGDALVSWLGPAAGAG